MYFGDYAEDATVYIIFNTFTSDDPSASCTITDFANTDIHIHKDDGLEQRNNAAGITVSVDFDGITGNHLVTIDTADDTVAAFWIVGHDYHVRIEGTTVDGATVNAWIGSFSIENRFMRGTDSAATAAKLLDYVQLLARSDAAIETDNAAELAEINANEGSGEGNFSSQTDSDEARRDKQTDIETDTAVIGALGAGLTAVPWNSNWDTEVQSECADALTAYDPPTKAEMDTAHALLATVAKQDVIDGIVDNILVDTNELQGLISSSKIAAQVKGMDADTLTASAVATGAIDSNALSAGALDDIHDEVIEGTITHRQAMSLILAVLTGKTSGGGTTTLTFRNTGDSKDRLVCTVDSDGNRTAVGTRDGS